MDGYSEQRVVPRHDCFLLSHFPKYFSELKFTHTHLELLESSLGTSLVIQWLRLFMPKAGGLGFDPWSGNQIPHTMSKDPVCYN